MAEYHFVTNWRIEAPVQAVWDAIIDSLSWPHWWRGVVAVEELEAGDPLTGIGNLRRYTWRSKLPYNLVFEMRTTHAEPLKTIEGAAQGELAGTGKWFFTSEGTGVTVVRYEWDVRTTKAWMNLFAPVARPFFAWNHDVIMRWGEAGLRRHLGIGELAAPT
jgi:hypothetical protein